MKNPVLIKGNKYGISLVLSDTLDFSELLNLIGEKFKESARFFDTDSQIAIRFEGRTLTNEEIEAVLDKIKTNCSLNICYILDTSKTAEDSFTAVSEFLKQQEEEKEIEEEKAEETILSEPNTEFVNPNSEDGRFYRGTLRSGQAIDSNSSIIIIGDVNPGATVMAKGNIIILGCLKGNAFAGSDGNSHAFVAALDMIPMQIRIGNIIARSSDTKRPKKGFLRREPEPEAKIAYVENENIYIEPISRTVLSELNIR